MKLRWLVLATLCATMYGQAVRYDGNVTQPAGNVPPGAAANVMTVPNAIVTICGYPAVGNPCTNTVPIWQDQLTTVPQPPPIHADAVGRFGFWVTPGQYSYSVQTQSGKNVGNFPLSLTSPSGPPLPFFGVWSSTTNYLNGQLVTYNGLLYISLQDVNLNHQPDTSPAFWAVQTTFAPIPNLTGLATAVTSQQYVYVQDNNSGTGLGAGWFQWHAGSTTPDHCTLFSGSTGYWQRMLQDGALYVTDCENVKGDGVTNDTGGWNFMIAAVNNGVAKTVDGGGRTYFINAGGAPFGVITASITFQNIKILQNPAIGGAYLIRFTGNGTKILHVTVDGNMNNMSSTCGGTFCDTYACIAFLGDNFTIDDITVQNCAGPSINSGNTGDLSEPAGTPHFGHVVSNFKILNGWGDAWNNYTMVNSTYTNGYIYNTGLGFKGAYLYPLPYQQTFVNATQQGACMVIWFNSSHIKVSNTVVQGCGRDSFFISTGAHDIEISGSAALYGGDGGFTSNVDSVNPGLPGDGKCSYNIVLTGNTAKGNVVAGAGSTCATNGFVVNGGSYINNGRGVGESASTNVAVMSNIYAFDGTTDLSLNRPRVADDRQGRIVTGTATGTGPWCVATTGWVPNLWQYNPNLAFYDVNGAFRGFGFSVSDSATQVCFNLVGIVSSPVTPASIANGWYVTQRVTFNGAWLGNGVAGSGTVVGGGFMPGSQGATTEGFDVFMASNTSVGQHGGFAIDGKLAGIELIQNPKMDTDVAFWGPSAGTITPTFTSTGCQSPGCMSIVNTALGAHVDSQPTASTASYFASTGAWVRVSGWVNQSGTPFSTANGYTVLGLCWSSQCAYSSPIRKPGWSYVTITQYIPPGSAPVISIFPKIGTVTFDQASEQILIPDTSSNGNASVPDQYLPY